MEYFLSLTIFACFMLIVFDNMRKRHRISTLESLLKMEQNEVDRLRGWVEHWRNCYLDTFKQY